MSTEWCPLCGALSDFKGRVIDRSYYSCAICDLRFISPRFHLAPDQEFSRYLLHQNSLSDTGYVRFLMGAVDGLAAHLKKGHKVAPTVLDYGSGPAPVLVQLLNKAGFDAIGYDPFFGDRSEPGVLVTSSLAGKGPFDAVVSTETVEHFRSPRTEWDQMISVIRPGGFLVVMTSLVLPGINLSSWYYATDPTHVAFYSEATFRYIASHWSLILAESNGRNQVVMHKPLPG